MSKVIPIVGILMFLAAGHASASEGCSHDCRKCHSITEARMLDLGFDSRVISKLLGHSDPSMMEKYTKFKVEAMRAAISFDSKRIGAQELHKTASGDS